MAQNLNSSQLVKTYGKPRRTQLLSQNSLWSDDLTDDFDKCMSIQDCQQTTFISPENTMEKNNHTKCRNTTNTNGRISKKFQNTLIGHKSISKYKRNLMYSFEYKKVSRKTSLLKNHSTKQHSNSLFSLDTESDIPNNLKDTQKFIHKPSMTYKLPSDDSSTPVDLNKMSFKKKRKKIIHKSKYVCTFNKRHISKLSEKTNSPFIVHNANLIAKEKFDKLEKYTLKSGSFFPVSNKQSNLKKKLDQNSMTKNRGKCNKNSTTPTDWTVELSHYFYNKDALNVKNFLNNCKKKLCNENLIQSTKYKNTNSLKEEEDPVSSIDVNESIKLDSSDHNIIEVNSKSLENRELYSICDDEDTSNATNENKIIEDINSSNVICINNNDVSVNNQRSIDRPTVTSCNSPILLKYVTPSHYYTEENVIQNNVELSSLNNSYISTNESCLDSFNTMSPNKENNKYRQIFKQRDSNKLNNCVDFTQTQCFEIENNEFNDCALESQILLDVTNIISSNSINDKIKKCNQSSNLSLDKFTVNNSFSNDSNSHQTSSCSTEQVTVINKQNSSCIILKNNTISSKLSMDEKSIGPDTCTNYSNNDQMISQHNCSMFPDHCQNDCITTKEKTKTNYNDSSSGLLSQFENMKTVFKDVSCIEHEEQTTIETQTLMSMCNNPFGDKLKESNASNFSDTISRRKRYAIRFDKSICLLNLYDDFKYENNNNFEFQNSTHRFQDCSQSVLFQQNTTGFCLQPGKKWRRSISIVRNYINGQLDQTTNFTSNITKGRKWNSTVDYLLQQQSISHRKLDQSSTLRNSIRLSEKYSENSSTENEIAKKYIFEKCYQKNSIPFESWFNTKIKKNWKKVGEGVYGEVFSYTSGKNNSPVVVKIIPIEGETCINNEHQKKFYEVYSEILIASELNKLFDKNGFNHTESFCKMKSFSCVQGKYPQNLIELWEEFDNEKKGSENDNPCILPNTQTFIVLEMEDGGIDVEHFVFNSATQALYAFIQIVFGLAVAEQELSYEHRDLHIGNILIKKSAAKRKISFTLNGQTFKIPSEGIKVTIIDFTLSRMTYFNKSIYNDLSKDNELFTSHGDYQFEIYRLMKNETNDQWNSYKPKTNIYWLHYVLNKLLTSVKYKNEMTNVHKRGLNNLSKLENSILDFGCAKELAENNIILDLLQ